MVGLLIFINLIGVIYAIYATFGWLGLAAWLGIAAISWLHRLEQKQRRKRELARIDGSWWRDHQ